MIDGELAGSMFDADTTDTTGMKGGTAGRAKISKTINKYTMAANYHYYGTDFASIANPNFTADRTGFSGNVGTSFGPSNVSLSLNRDRDNVSDDSAKPVVYSTSGTLAYNIAVEPWPSINVTYSRSIQDSKKEPSGSQDVRNTSDTVSVSLSKSGKEMECEPER